MYEKIKNKLEKISVLKIEFDFLMQQNARLIRQNRELQKYCNGRNTRPQNIYDSLGNAILVDYCGVTR